MSELKRGTPLKRAHFGFGNSPVQNGDRLSYKDTNELVTLISSYVFEGNSKITIRAPFKGIIEDDLNNFNFHQKMPK